MNREMIRSILTGPFVVNFVLHCGLGVFSLHHLQVAVLHGEHPLGGRCRWQYWVVPKWHHVDQHLV